MEKSFLTSEDIRISMPVIGMKRYYDIVVLKIVGLDKINELLEMIQMQSKYVEKIKNILPPKCKYDQSYGIELIQLSNALDQNGNVIGLFTVGTITSAFLNDVNKALYEKEH